MGFKTTEMRWDVETAHAYMRSTWFSAAGSLLVGFLSGCCSAPAASGVLSGGAATVGYIFQAGGVLLLVMGLFSGFNALIRVVQMPEAQALMIGKGERAGAGILAFLGFSLCGLSLLAQIGMFLVVAFLTGEPPAEVPA